MHTGSRAFCFLMALVAGGTEVASAATSLTPEQNRIEAKQVAASQASPVGGTVSAPVEESVVSGLCLTVTPYLLHLNENPLAYSFHSVRFDGCAPVLRTVLSVQTPNTWSTHCPPPSDDGRNRSSHDRVPKTYDPDGRVLASLADANERQLLFVKITRG